MNNLVSVIVPVYNVEKYLNKCLQTITSQTYKNIEILLVNDGSTDNSLVLCKKWKRQDHRIRIINKKNGGLSSARNEGLVHARGKYILFVDSDDWINKYMVRKMVRAFEKYSADMVVSQYIIADNNGHESISYIPTSKEKVVNQYQFVKLLLQDKEITNHIWRKMFRKSNMPISPFLEGHNFEDMEAMPRLLKACNSIVILSDPLYYYRERANSIVHEFSSSNILDYYNATNSSLNSYLEMQPSLNNYISEAKFIHYYVLLKEIIKNNLKMQSLKSELINRMKCIPIKNLKNTKVKLFSYALHKSPRLVYFFLKFG